MTALQWIAAVHKQFRKQMRVASYCDDKRQWFRHGYVKSEVAIDATKPIPVPYVKGRK